MKNHEAVAGLIASLFMLCIAASIVVAKVALVVGVVVLVLRFLGVIS